MDCLPIAMKAIRHAWKGEKELCADYIRLLASELGKGGHESQERNWLHFLDVLEGRKPEVFLKAWVSEPRAPLSGPPKE